jgi:hypothetical protein
MNIIRNALVVLIGTPREISRKNIRKAQSDDTNNIIAMSRADLASPLFSLFLLGILAGLAIMAGDASYTYAEQI